MGGICCDCQKANAQQQAQRQRKLNENVAEAEAETSSLHAKTQAAAPRVAPTVGVSQNGAWTCGCGYRNTANSKFCRQCGAARAQSGSMNYASSEGRSTEGGGGLKRPPLTRETMPKPSLNHVVKPMTESHHSHTEASISGREGKVRGTLYRSRGCIFRRGAACGLCRGHGRPRKDNTGHTV